MKKLFLLALMVPAIFFCGCQNKNANANTAEEDAGPVSDVYYTENISPEGVMQLFEYLKDSVKGNVGIKVHFGEDGNTYFVPATMVEPLCKSLNATLIETNVAYKGRRSQTETHIELARDHGFTFAPIDILDADGEVEIPIEGGKQFKSAFIGKNLEKYETVIYFTHFKGHGRCGFGGCIKNASMGMATPRGKKIMHSSDFPEVVASNCIACNACTYDCPVDAITITDKGPVIDREKCIGCGKCISTCPHDAIVPASDSLRNERFIEGLVEYAKAATHNHNNIYFNFVINLSPTCDCGSHPEKPLCENIGILLSTDIVAIEAAAQDLVNQATNSKDAFLDVNKISGQYQIDYAEKLGMGNKKYNLINIDKK